MIRYAVEFRYDSQDYPEDHLMITGLDLLETDRIVITQVRAYTGVYEPGLGRPAASEIKGVLHTSGVFYGVKERPDMSADQVRPFKIQVRGNSDFDLLDCWWTVWEESQRALAFQAVRRLTVDNPTQERIDRAIVLINQIEGHSSKVARREIAKDAIAALQGEPEDNYTSYAHNLRLRQGK